MMKKISNIILLFILYSCAINDPGDCFTKSSDLVTKTVSLSNFTRVIVREGIELEIIQGGENRLDIQYYDEQLDQISFNVIDDRLELNNNNGCQFFTGFKPAKVRLTASNLTEIRNASQYVIKSADTLRFNSLSLISEDFLEDEVNVGDFDIKLNSLNLSIITNNVSTFSLSGRVETFDINFASGQGKLTADKLRAEHIHLFHRGTSDLIVYPTSSITGEIRGTGHVIAINRPPLVEVDQLYTGRLIFRD